jgi:hypothetical protein
LVVLLIILFVTFGGFLLAGKPGLAGEEITGGGEPGPPVTVVEGVTIHPAPGWSLTDRLTEPQGVRLISGTGNLLVLVSPVGGGPEGQLLAYIEQVLEPEATQLSVTPVQPITIPSGNVAAVASYVGAFQGASSPLEGEVVAVVGASGTAVVFDGWAQEGQFGAARDDVRAMVAGAEVG